MYFEGPEKKIEIVVNGAAPSLRRRGGETWRRVVRRANARVLSTVSSKACDAYLLSESSLFVFDSRVIMITCGRTTLVPAVMEMIDLIGLDQVELLIYERKNEFFPAYQPSTFYDDARVLKQLIPGRAFRFGDEDEHHVYLFHLENRYQPEPGDMTLEILMHGIRDGLSSVFSKGNGATRELEKLRSLHPGFVLDEHFFEPEGYSLNAVRDREYYTLHVTPQKQGSYVSFETNRCGEADVDQAVRSLLEVFAPRSYLVVFFHPGGEAAPVRSDYQLRKRVVQQLDCGFVVSFHHFFKPQSGQAEAVELLV